MLTQQNQSTATIAGGFDHVSIYELHTKFESELHAVDKGLRGQNVLQLIAVHVD